jgi:hypothetical protein
MFARYSGPPSILEWDCGPGAGITTVAKCYRHIRLFQFLFVPLLCLQTVDERRPSRKVCGIGAPHRCVAEWDGKKAGDIEWQQRTPQC